jgi:hypothetical protein
MPDKNDAVQGEGDYVAGRRFQDAERRFVKEGPVARKAREAEEALDGPERAELEAARRKSAEGEPRHFAKPDVARPADPPRTEEDVDRDLKATFPASDPAPSNPGAD